MFASTVAAGFHRLTSFRLAPTRPGGIPGFVEVIVPGRSNHDGCELPPVDSRVVPDGRHLESATLQRIGDESIVTMDIRQPLTKAIRWFKGTGSSVQATSSLQSMAGLTHRRPT
jgi:hypothetical protein